MIFSPKNLKIILENILKFLKNSWLNRCTVFQNMCKAHIVLRAVKMNMMIAWFNTVACKETYQGEQGIKNIFLPVTKQK